MYQTNTEGVYCNMKNKLGNIWEQVAQLYGVSTEEVLSSVEEALAYGQRQTDEQVQRQWAAMSPHGKQLSPDDAVLAMIKTLAQEKT